MSELSIEERYQKVKGILTGLWNQEDTTCGEAYEAEKFLDELYLELTKYPLAPVSSTLDRLLDSRSDLAAEAEADLGEIEHKGEKVMVKIKVVRGE